MKLGQISPIGIRFIVKGLLVAGIVEFSLIRTFSRMGILLPPREPVMSIFNMMMFVGSVAFNFASLLVILVLLWASYFLLSHRSKADRIAGSLLVIVITLSMLFLVVTPNVLVSILYNILSMFLVTILGISLIREGGSIERWLGVAITLSFVTTYLFKILPLLDQLLGLSLNIAGVGILNLGEALAVVATPLIFLLTYRYRRGSGKTLLRANSKAIIVSTIMASLFGSFYLASPWITSILAVWTLGFTMYLPFPFYIIAIWLFLYSLFSLPGDKKALAYGMLLILLAGHLIQLTYLNLLAILGMLFVSRPAVMNVD
ncbi:MAG: hypothetical protein HYU02_06835 [Thaumarchaeota archaeon]|nr:hypothetical protein [Nitrososphaerota archaeon]